jgi:2-dehydropantoate 2-reductase
MEAGLRVDSIEGDFLVKPALATDSPESIDPVDIVILAVKAWQLRESLGQLHSLIKNETVILPLLNGVDHIDLLRNEFGDEHLLLGLCRISSFVVELGHVNHIGVHPYIAFGELDNRKSARIDTMQKVFKKLSGVLAEVPANIELALWEKFLMICAFSGVAR